MVDTEGITVVMDISKVVMAGKLKEQYSLVNNLLIANESFV